MSVFLALIGLLCLLIFDFFRSTDISFVTYFISNYTPSVPVPKLFEGLNVIMEACSFGRANLGFYFIFTNKTATIGYTDLDRQ